MPTPDQDPRVIAGLNGEKVPSKALEAAAKVQDALVEAVEHGQHATALELAGVWYELEELSERKRLLKADAIDWEKRQG